MKKFPLQETTNFTIVNQSEFATLQESAKSTAIPSKIVVELEAIHNGMTLNNTLYSSGELRKAVESWTTPYNKPVLKNHDMYTEPLGRVLSARYDNSRVAPGRETIILKCEITDPDAISKVLDGRYATVSVGGTASAAHCSVCGKDVVNEGFCGHYRGKAYKSKESGDMVKAHYIVSGLSFDEISFVNQPADVHAQVTNRNFQEPAASTDEGSQTESVNNAGAVPVSESVADLIDGALGLEEQEVPVAEDAEGNQEGEIPVQEDNNGEGEELSLEEKVAQLEEDATKLSEQISALTASNETLTSQVAELNQTVEQKDVEITALKEANKAIASFLRTNLIEQIADVRVTLGLDKPEDRETVMQEYKTVSTRLLEKQLNEYKIQVEEKRLNLRNSVRNTVVAPGLAIHDQKNSVEVNGDEGEDGGILESASGGQEPTYDAMKSIEALVGFFSRSKRIEEE